jgi:uncharacterized delta-60 repeat protein
VKTSISVRRPALVAAFAITIMLAGQPAALAGPGDIDGSFGTGGRVTTDFGGAEDGAEGVLAQSNGKLVAVGESFSGSLRDTGDFAVARYLANGDPDLSFSGDGRRRTDFDGKEDEAAAVARDADGNLVVVGSSETTGDSRRMAVVRYLPGGGLDPAFSGDGMVRTAFSGWADALADDVAVQPDGKIVVAGGAVFSLTEGKVSDIAVARFRPNGTLDPSFSGDGRATVDFSDSDGTAAVAVLPSGKILVAGQSSTPSEDGRFVAVRYLSDGRLDHTFGGDGKVVVNMVPDAFESLAGLGVRPDGRILLGGSADDAVSASSDSDLAVVLLNENGSLHLPFGGGDAKVFRDFGSKESPVDMTMQDDGKLLFAGTRLFPLSDPIAIQVFRLNAGGAPDGTFGTGGKAEVEFPDAVNAQALSVDRDGRAVPAGSTNGDFALTRLQA